MIFGKRLKKTAACILAGVMVLALSTGALADSLVAGTPTAGENVYNVTVSYTVTNAAGGQISIIALAGEEVEGSSGEITYNTGSDGATDYTSPNNILWIDQQEVPAADDAGVSTGTFTFKVDATAAADGFYVKSGYTGADNVIYDYVTIAAQGGEDDGDKPTVTDDQISIGTTENVFGVTNGKVVTLKGITLESIPEGKTIAIGGEEAYYTSYATGENGEVEIKFVTIVTEDVTAADVTYIDGEPTQIMYGDADSTGEIDGADVSSLTLFAVKKMTADDVFMKLTVDINGDGVIDGADVSEATLMAVKKQLIPSAASK